jgi:hypothetical protein
MMGITGTIRGITGTMTGTTGTIKPPPARRSQDTNKPNKANTCREQQPNTNK